MAIKTLYTAVGRFERRTKRLQPQLSNHPVRRSGVHGRYAGNGDLEHAQLENPALG